MMDLRTLQSVNRQAAQRSARQGRVPLLIEPEDVSVYFAGDGTISIPYIGARRVTGYRPVGEPLFVDKTGMGHESESALTLRRFLTDHVAAGPSYWGTVEEGEFQCYVQRYERIVRRVKR